MRIVGGRLKGRSLATPKGRSTRPTSDRAREAVFNILAHAPWSPFQGGDFTGARVIDAFAGSGALGFEALSRGAAFALFIDTDAGARGVIRTNAETFALMGATRIHRRSAAALGVKPAGLGAPFDAAFVDPPYGQALAAPALAALVEGGWLAPQAVCVVETAADEAVFPTPDVGAADARFTLMDSRVYGAARVWFFRCGEH